MAFVLVQHLECLLQQSLTDTPHAVSGAEGCLGVELVITKTFLHSDSVSKPAHMK